jgi:hypothetical protein
MRLMSTLRGEDLLTRYLLSLYVGVGSRGSRRTDGSSPVQIVELLDQTGVGADRCGALVPAPWVR